MPSTTPKQWEVVLNLTSCGFRKPRSLWLGPFLVATILALGAIGALVSSLPVERTLLATAAAATAGGLLVALQQAVRARQEVSLERFFDRLELTTRRRLEAASARMNAAVVSPDERETDEARERYARELWIFYVFSEIDTLDYMMKRYQLGALTKEQARRAISHFGTAV